MPLHNGDFAVLKDTAEAHVQVQIEPQVQPLSKEWTDDAGRPPQKRPVTFQASSRLSSAGEINQGTEHLAQVAAVYKAVQFHGQNVMKETLPDAAQINVTEAGKFARAKNEFAIALGRSHSDALQEVNNWRNEPGLLREVRAWANNPQSPVHLVANPTRETPQALNTALARYQRLEQVVGDFRGMKMDAIHIPAHFSAHEGLKGEGSLQELASKMDRAASSLSLERLKMSESQTQSRNKLCRDVAFTGALAFGGNYLMDRAFFSRSSPTALTYATDLGSAFILVTQRSNLEKAGVMMGSHLLAKLMETNSK